MIWRMIKITANVAIAGTALLLLSKKRLFEARARLLDAELLVDNGELDLTVGKSISLFKVSLNDGIKISTLNITASESVEEVKNSLIGGTVISMVRMFFGSPVLKALNAAERAITLRLETDDELSEEEKKRLLAQLDGITDARSLFY